MKRLWITMLVMLCGWLTGASQALADCMIEGDTIRVSGRIWTDEGKQWMAQLDKPVCVWGINPQTQASYKVSDTVVLVRLEAADAKVKNAIDNATFPRAVMDGRLSIDRSATARYKCVVTINAIAEAGSLVSEVVARDNAKESWVMRASPKLQEMFANAQFAENVGKNALSFIHPVGNYDGVNSWSVTTQGKILMLNMRLMWKGKLTQKLYTTDIIWKSSKQGHISAEIVKDDSTLPVTSGKIEKMDDYFRTHIWPLLYNKLK